MPIRPEIVPPASTLEFLKRCFRFVSLEWPHAVREHVPDQGFEQRFRESCIQNLQSWTISEQRELRLGVGLDTTSGVAHEIDIVARSSTVTAILEAKNLGDMPGKNDIIVFFAKVLDYLLANPAIALNDICLAFMSRNSFEDRALAACLGLGIHPVASDIRPLPVLIDSAQRMEHELRDDLLISEDIQDRFDDLCAQLNNLHVALNETWLDNRCGYLSEDSLLFKAVGPLLTDALAQQLRQANSDCTDLLDAFRAAKTAGGA
jgi:hypothetical protein